MLTDYSGGQMSSMVENVVLINIVFIYGTMLLRVSEISAKIAWSSSQSSVPRATKPIFKI
jgi:hypothetical protein